MAFGVVGITDYLLIGVFFMVCVAIGWFTSRNRKQALSEYFLANRGMSIIPVGFSTAATLLSSITLTGHIGEFFRYGFSYAIYYIIISTCLIVASYTILPRFHRVIGVSVYQFLEQRYDITLRRLASAQYIFTSLIYLGGVLYGPSISITAVSGLPYWTIALLGGAICTTYSTLGGFRAVIWTDVFQSLIAYGAMIMLIAFGINKSGGTAAVWNKAFNGTHAADFNWIETATTRYSIWTLIAQGFTCAFVFSFANQAGAQRILCMSTVKQARQAYQVGIAFIFITHCLVVTLALVVMASYTRCDPKQIPGYDTDDKLFVYAATDYVGSYPGLVGLCLVAIISSSLSTFSSYLNALSAVTMEDFLVKIFAKTFRLESTKMKACKILSAAYGVLAVLISFLIPWLGGIIKYTIALRNSTEGIVLAMILLGIITTRANAKACKISIIISLVILCLLNIATFSSTTITQSLPHTNVECETVYTTSDYNGFPLAPNITIEESGVLQFLRISFHWFSPVSFLITFLGTYFISFFIGAESSSLKAESQPNNSRLLSARKTSNIKK